MATAQHQGHWLKEKIERSGVSKAEFARRIGVAREHLHSWLKMEKLRMRPDISWRIFDQLNLTNRLRGIGHRRKTETPEGDGAVEKIIERVMTLAEVELLFEQAMRLDAGRLVANTPADVDDGFEPNVEPYSEVKIPVEIPMFELSVAAGDWSDVVEVGETPDAQQQALGVFRVRLSGDSMKPEYQSGDVVEFRMVRAEERLRLGKDYYVQRADGTATFKRLFKISEERLGFCAVNKKRCPDPFNVERSDIVRMALAVAKVQILE